MGAKSEVRSTPAAARGAGDAFVEWKRLTILKLVPALATFLMNTDAISFENVNSLVAGGAPVFSGGSKSLQLG